MATINTPGDAPGTRDAVDALLHAEGWTEVYRRDFEAQPASTVDAKGLDLAPWAQRLARSVAGGLYRHQAEAVAAYLSGRDVCLATGTASGKTLAFQLAAFDCLSRSVADRVAVIYPLRALAQQQTERWSQAIRAAQVPVAVGRIDGSVHSTERLRILRNARVVVFTPDVIHAWLLSNLGTDTVRQFCRQLRLIVIDEAHAYSGVFGSHAAFLFRRLRHAVVAQGGAPPRWFCASATISEPERHIEALCGARPHIIGPDRDSSPRQPLTVSLTLPPPDRDINSSLGRLLAMLALLPNQPFLAFADSRRQVESLAVIARRGDRSAEEDDLVDENDVAGVLPYRSGYEESDRAQIQQALQEGRLKGVISTSALELGIDIGGLAVGIQVGVPRSSATLLQRMGRIGRERQGRFLVIPGANPFDRMVLDDPRRLFDRPLAKTTIYLENRRVQYIHALCLASPGGEADALGASEDWRLPEIEIWPPGFADLCRDERRGQVPPELQALKTDGGEDPWHAFPLRDAGIEFRIELRTSGGAIREPLGTIGYAQLMREAYPGAVYYHMAKPYRVTAVLMTQRKVVVVPERHYTTRPLLVPPSIFPNLRTGAIRGLESEALALWETEMQISESVRGWQERRGNTQTSYTYPTSHWQREVLRRNFFTTGVCLFHPAWPNDPSVTSAIIAGLYDAFVMEVPTESAEVAAGMGRLREDQIPEGERRFVALYDRAYGSLRLTGRLLEGDMLSRCLKTAVALLREAANGAWTNEDGIRETYYGEPPESCAAAAAFLQSLSEQLHRHPLRVRSAVSWTPPGSQTERTLDAGSERVIMPGSTGMLMHGAEEEFLIEAVFFHPRDGLMYRGRRVGDPSQEVMTFFPVNRVRPIPEISKMGRYLYETGEVVAD